MRLPQLKSRMIREAHRLLVPGGRYGLHELCLTPDDLAESTRLEIQKDLAHAIHHCTRPLTRAEWQDLLEAAGSSVQMQAQAPMRLLEPGRILRDEGLFGALRFASHLLSHREARR